MEFEFYSKCDRKPMKHDSLNLGGKIREKNQGLEVGKDIKARPEDLRVISM